jgi:arylsulfatase A-like enzyme
MSCQAASTWFALPSIHSSLYSPQAYTEGGNLTQQIETLAQVLSEEGYNTAGFVGANPYANLWKDGFDEFWNGGLESEDNELSLSQLSEEYNLYWLKYLVLKERTSITDVTERALDWYTSTDGPRFLWVHLMDTHEPYLPGLRVGLDIGLPKVYKAFYRHIQERESLSKDVLQTHRELYDKTLNRVQQPLINFLEELDNRSTVVVTGDHGQEIERGWHAHARMYDEIIRVPFFCRWTLGPEIEYPEGPVRQIDLAPTIVDAVGGLVPSSWEGEPIDDRDRDSYSIGNYDYFGYAYAALRSKGKKVIKSFDCESFELTNTEYYDLSDDPGEIENLHPDDEECKLLEERLDGFLDRDDIRLDIYSYPPDETAETSVAKSRLRELCYME